MTYPLRGNPNINQFRLQHGKFVQYLEEIAAHNEVRALYWSWKLGIKVGAVNLGGPSDFRININ